MKNILTLSYVLFSSFISIGQSSTRTEVQAIKLSDSLYSKLIEGADFKFIATKFSEDPGTKEKNGQYNNCKYGTFTPEFEEVVRKLKPFKISKPFKTPYGYHIAQVLKKSNTSFTVRHILITFQN
jgi:peptidyl-prolyl cis-trans isomerase SurA